MKRIMFKSLFPFWEQVKVRLKKNTPFVSIFTSPYFKNLVLTFYKLRGFAAFIFCRHKSIFNSFSF